MNEIYSLTISYLKLALFGGECPRADITEDTVTELYKCAKPHDMAHLLCFALEKQGIKPSAKLTAYKLRAMTRCARMEYELENLYAFFESAGIDFLPLKGAVIRGMYPENWMRTSSDIDVLVHEADIGRASDLLVSRLGYVIDERRYHDVSFHTKSGVHIELHFSLKERMENCDPMLERVWDYAVRDSGHRFVMTGEFLLFYHTVHAVHHFLSGGCGIRTVADLKFLSENVEYCRKDLESMLDACGILKFYNALCELCEVWFGDGKATRVFDELGEFIINGGAFGTYKGAAAVSRMQSKSKSGYIMGRMFPPLSEMQIYYPVLKKVPVLLPILYVFRLLSVPFSVKRRTHMKTIIEISHGDDLLSTLGL